MVISIRAPNTIQSFKKKTNKPIPRKLPERRTERWKDAQMKGQTLIHRTLPATAGGPIFKKHILMRKFPNK